MKILSIVESHFRAAKSSQIRADSANEGITSSYLLDSYCLMEDIVILNKGQLAVSLTGSYVVLRLHSA